MAVVLLSFGILGMARLQWGSTSAATGSLQRSLAQVQALDMAERMWLDLTDPDAFVDEWRTTHQGSLPDWTGSVEADPSDPALRRIRIEWTAPSASSGALRFDHFVRLPEVAP